MTKSTITRERIQRIIRAINSEAYDEEEIREWLSSDEIMELSRMALAAMDGEPVAWTWHYREQWYVTSDKRRAAFVAKDGDVAVLPLYRYAQPAPVMVGEIDFIDHFERIIGERDDDIDICQLGSANYDALMLAALDAFRSAMLNGGKS
ncbi:hypothetical protein [Klebsiella pneumoniae]|uniref:hypothetical protein n=1 Tax=Klebsiella pneumoniae TaxID=573 RepID=UPI00190AF440|nr:hypothetical protein [Klebsiella pneumoniae]MBK2873982.1 hypothetical protein [Klebsiella pneumoniae]MDT8738259.1 hypothetical protein [Klebsiella pneumoniae]HBW1353594.1 hypothetical protein [Klebsiella pneumoniae]HBW1364935.1 hypothetical protein [Klebsiella pneumoniae]